MDKLKFDVVDEDGNNLLATEEDVKLSSDEDDDVEEVVADNEDVVEEDKAPVVKTKSRAQERIRELIKKNKDAEAKWASEVETLKAQLSVMNKESLNTQKDFIEARITDVKKALTRAQEEGKFEEAADFMTQLSDLQTRKLVVDANSNRKEEPEEKKVSKEIDDTEFQTWAVKNRKWWQKDPVKTNLAQSIARKIEKEGLLSPEDPAYFEELDERINEIWVEDAQDMEDLQSSSKEEVKTKKTPQVTTGASRTSTVKSKRPEIQLSKEERQMAQRMGMSELDWAKQKYRQLKNKDENGYNIIQLNK